MCCVGEAISMMRLSCQISIVCAAATVCWLSGITRRCGPVAERIIPTSTRGKGGTRVDEKGHVVRLALSVLVGTFYRWCFCAAVGLPGTDAMWDPRCLTAGRGKSKLQGPDEKKSKKAPDGSNGKSKTRQPQDGDLGGKYFVPT